MATKPSQLGSDFYTSTVIGFFELKRIIEKCKTKFGALFNMQISSTCDALK